MNIDELFAGRDTAIARDLKLNLKRLLAESALPPADAALALVAAGAALASPRLVELAAQLAAVHGFAAAELTEARESAAIMGMLNVYYRTRHQLAAGQGEAHVAEHYRQAGLRMQGLARPTLGKERFEQLALTVSALNGCDQCVNAHERELVAAGVPRERIHELIRLAAIAKGVAVLVSQAT